MDFPVSRLPNSAHNKPVSAQFWRKLALCGLFSAAFILGGCYESDFEKQDAPLPPALVKEIAKIGARERDPIFIRIFKKEAEFEVWKRTPNGQYALLKTYEICSWSGELGPKFQEGDRQSPEGFYTVSPAQLNPNSAYHLSFNIGFPNAYDRAKERTGSFLMVHGACSSAGCYSMEDAQIEEIYALAREAFLGGQEKFQVHAFPFRMTPENMAIFRESEHMPFWRTLKRGYEHFELTKIAPKVDVCEGEYRFNAFAAEDAKFRAQEKCPAYDVPERLEKAVDDAVKRDKSLEDEIVARWTDPKERRHAELAARLKIEQDRIAKFQDRGLGYSSHIRQRVLEIGAEFAALGYRADGSLPTAEQTATPTSATASAASEIPASVAPQETAAVPAPLQRPETPAVQGAASEPTPASPAAPPKQTILERFSKLGF